MRIKILVLLSLWAAVSRAESGPEAPPANVRIVKLGVEHQRCWDGGSHNINSYQRMKYVRDPATGRFKVLRAKDDVKRLRTVDVDGDGTVGDDEVIFHPFDLSLDNPLSPVAPFYDTSVGSQRIFGGLCAQVADAEENGTGFTEDGMNGTEEGAGFQPRRNWTFFREDFNPYSPFRIHGVWVWQKPDFLNGGADVRVSFDENSELRHLVMRYFLGIEAQRWVVRNGDQFYISEDVYLGAGEKLGEGGGKIHVCHPAKTRWAEYNPQDYRIAFDAKAARFESRTFDNVTAVGWYIAKDSLSPALFGSKWYAYEADAVVHREARPSESLDMVQVAARQPFYMSTRETPYTLWRQVHRLARYNGYAGPRGFTFRSYGDMGSMGWPGVNGTYLRHSGDEPVTQITFADALAWCNALSQQESKTPCYYTDSECTQVFREVVKYHLYPEEQRRPPTVYVKWGADGYRLPTAAEWTAACGSQKSEVSDRKSEKTSPVGSGAANANGLYDMESNVREMVWTFGDSVNLETLNEFTVLGADFRGAVDPASSSASAYGDRPFSGSGAIGFRVVRREAGGGVPEFRIPDLASRIPQWLVSRELLTAVDSARQLKKPLDKNWLELTEVNGTRWGTYEVTYAKWKPVYDWAAANGYEFDTQGEMGSMAYWGFGKDWKPGSHGPDEPVTGITHYDACVWLNALSELEGLRPVYYAGKKPGELLRRSMLFRPLQRLRGEIDEIGGVNKVFMAANVMLPLSADASADGYRLPQMKEFVPLMGPQPKGDSNPWIEKGWFVDNSGLTTHPAGEKGADENGLFDLVGNAAELADPVFEHKDGGKGGGQAYAFRMGGGFFDITENLIMGYTYAEPPMNHQGYGYPDTGFRVIRQKGGGK